MKIYLHHDTGSAYTLGEGGAILFRPLSIKNELITPDDDEWGVVDYDLVGDEAITHEGEAMTIKQFKGVLLDILNGSGDSPSFTQRGAPAWGDIASMEAFFRLKAHMGIDAAVILAKEHFPDIDVDDIRSTAESVIPEFPEK